MGEISIEDITKNSPSAARAVEFESIGGGNKLVKKTRGHLEAEKNLRGKNCDELMMARRELTKQRRYSARRTMQEMPKVKNKQAACQALDSGKEGETTSDKQNGRRSWKDFRRTSIRMMR